MLDWFVQFKNSLQTLYVRRRLVELVVAMYVRYILCCVPFDGNCVESYTALSLVFDAVWGVVVIAVVVVVCEWCT